MSIKTEIWWDEIEYMIAWDRLLTKTEAESLIIGASSNSYNNTKFTLLLHHADEPIVRDVLLNATNSTYPKIATVSQFVLFKLRDNPEERLRIVLNTAVSGGLELNNVRYLLTPFDEPPNKIRDEVDLADSLSICALSTIVNFIDPVDDKEYLPLILEYLTLDYVDTVLFSGMAVRFLGDPENDHLLQEFEDEYNSQIGENDTRLTLQSYSITGFDVKGYEREVRLNLLMINISYTVIAIWIIAYIFYLRWRFKQINSMDIP